MRSRTFAVAVTMIAITAGAAGANSALASGTPGDAPVGASVTTRQMREVARQRVFFGHQSVGWNLMDGMNALYGRKGLPAPNIVDGSTGLPSGGVFAQAEIGSNGDPVSKINDFAAHIRAGAGSEVRVAFMKLCFVDFWPGSRARPVFRKYRRTMRSLAGQYPRVAFLHVTVPLTTNDPAGNVVRQRYNRLMRRAFASSGRLFDLAKIESTRPNGSRVTGRWRGKRYHGLYPGYASDEGHLNGKGAQRAARVMIRVIANAA